MPFTVDAYEKVLVREVRNQAQAAILAWGDVDLAGQRRADPFWSDRVWMGLQGFASACANISKLFDSRNKSVNLASIFSGVKFSPAMDRSWRNSLDHFDERMEDWFKASAGLADGVQDRAIRGEAEVGMSPPPSQFRRFDPTTKVLIVLKKDGTGTDRFELAPIFACVEQIKVEADRLLGA